ncbi:translocation/assembly module TamB domain-containing protein [Plectonema cf. radiosum LEGE 06105]|uniref:Translocation/assembly module TamB domain-containing protein n=1 Tax=Plectonema cf. radiosum LEGE 06105 TaxID=945769 RepID=A0A8J7F6P2_9CYAN|nr:translocation/assembly module TamB domain-containing protein [Plectonema radiosum]MBE9216420.1 translocation/assembly module TamB domain-containing protein [Plectonema cf. radiosum LEGE 06105]
MTPPNTPPESDSQAAPSQPRKRVWLRNTIKIAGVSLLGLGVAGYFGLDYWIRRKLPPLLDEQLSEFINREVKVGEVRSWSITGVRLENSSIPATENDPNYVRTKAVDIGFNPIGLLFTQTLPLRISLIEPDVYIEEDKQGEWIRLNLDTGEGELPFDIDAKIQFEKARVAVLPQALKNPFVVEQINGFLNYNQNKPFLLQYGVNAPFVKGKLDIDGETQFNTWKSQINARIDNLSLPDLSNYVKDNIPVTIPSGELNANLQIDLPSLSELPFVKGTANLQRLQVKSPQLKVPVNATANLRFDGQKVSFAETRASYGSLITAVSGVADLNKGFDLKVVTNSFNIANLLKTTSIQSPINIDGNLQAQLLVKGNAQNPILLGNVVSQRGIVIDKTVFSKVNAIFGGNLQQVVLDEFRATPATGGDIRAKGEVLFPQSLPSVKDFSQSKIALDFDALIPNPGAIIAAYGVTDDMVNLGSLSAEGKVGGTIANPQAILSWKLPSAEVDRVGQVSGSGEVELAGNQVTLNNTTLQTADGKVNVDGRANLATNVWNAAVNANSLVLNPFLAKIENVGERVKQTPIFLQRGNLQLAGSLNNFNLGSIQGDVDLNLNVNQGNVAVNGNLNRGILTANANAARIGLNQLVPELPLSVTVANSQVNVSGRVQQLINFESIDSLDSFRASVDGNLILPEVKGNSRINFNGNGNFATKNWNLVANANSLPVNALLSAAQRKQFRLNQPVTLQRGNVKLAGNLDIIDNFDLNQVNGTADLNLRVNNGRVAVNGNLNQGILQANVNANSIPTNPFLPELPVNLTVANAQVNLEGRVNQLLEYDSRENLDQLNSFQATANGQLIVPGSRGNINFNASGNLATNNLQAVATASGISLNQLVSDSSLPVTLNNSTVNLTGKIDQLLANNFQNLNGILNTNLVVAQGTVKAIANLNNGKIASNINANNVNTPLLCRSFNISCPQLSQLYAKLDLTGEVKAFLEGNPILIQANQINATTQQQQLNAQGQIVIVPGDEGISSWNVATDLNVDVNSNLARLPLQSIARELAQENLPVLQGTANFSGRLVAQNLISQPLAPGNVRLAGNLNLRNLAVNNRIKFQPLLQGPINVNLGNNIEFDLRGKTDRIAANLQPCTRQDCLSPYLPTFFSLQQGINTQNPIILSGIRQGDVLDINLKNASLSLLNLVPVVEEIIPYPLGGRVTGNLDVNLFNLATAGNINIDTPSIGAVKAEELIADFSYDGEIARINAATLQIGKTEYALNGNLNLNSGDINGRLVANAGRVQDIFAAINVFNLEDLQAGVDSIFNPEYGDAVEVQTQSVGKPNAPILTQLRLFAQIVSRIRQQAALQQQDNTIQLDIQGEYNAELAVAGKITNPQINFQLQGNNWQWRPQKEYVTYNSRQGVVVRQNQPLDITQVIAQASYQNGTIQLQPIQLAVNGGLISLNGTLDGIETSATAQIQNLPVNIVERFVDLPVDINGNLNLQAQLGGNLFQPQIQQGAFSLINGTINQQQVGELAGNFNYIDSIARLNTTPNSVVNINAAVAYPLQPNRINTVAVQASIDNQAFALLDAFTQGEVQWIDGNGEIAIAINGELNPQADTIRGLFDNLVANSAIQIENATIRTKQLNNDIKLTAAGNAILNNQILQVEQISGNLAESPFLITGSLPLFQPLGNLQPLNITLGPGRLNLQGLYRGGIDANVQVSRTAINPVIGGNLSLENGRVFIPERREEQAVNTQEITNGQIITRPQQTQNFPIQPTFADFQVSLGPGFRFTQNLPRINFRMAGDFTINGGLNNLRGDGQIELTRGSVSLLENSFFITRDREQTVTFLPSRSLLNPQLDVELQTTVVDAPRFDRLQAINSEIRDDVVAPANPEQIDIRILVEGEASELLASLNNNTSSEDACLTYQRNIRFSGLGTLVPNSPSQLEQVSNCINANSQVSIQTRDILDNPAISLTSTPSRNDAEILSLLGNRTFAALQKLEQQITSGNETELLESLVLDYLVTPLETEITQEFLWLAQQPINSLGKSIGLTRLQVFPSFTGLKDINENSSARFTYDYEAGEFRFMYERRF